MNGLPFVSILMTAYNREKYIANAIQSVLESTYKNYELIIVDDCSTDNTFNIAKQYETKDKRVITYKNLKNLGDYPNRNKAASYAKGKYLKYVDADDKIYPFGLEIMVQQMEKFETAGWGLMSLPQDDDCIFPFLLSPREAYERHYLNKNRYVNYKSIFNKAPLSTIIKNEVFKEVGGFKEVRHFGDSDLWHRLAMKYPLVLMQDGLVWWRGHEGQEADIRKKNLFIQFKTINNSLNHILNKECPLNNVEKKSILKQFRNYKLAIIRSKLIKLQITDAITLFNNFMIE
jgi:glycosyltransferase involved in cell wall biosynthesis